MEITDKEFFFNQIKPNFKAIYKHFLSKGHDFYINIIYSHTFSNHFICIHTGSKHYPGNTVCKAGIHPESDTSLLQGSQPLSDKFWEESGQPWWKPLMETWEKYAQKLHTDVNYSSGIVFPNPCTYVIILGNNLWIQWKFPHSENCC